ncbi:hypothetical protein [Mycobacteroides abscessus]|uniref:hypothetical protein n=1 Tax=Mycobacteroides abscessus TaxID=36809 RepID=UPI0003708B96|nr:hypothetical protein [Mycobacteroides abscessus]
MTQVSRHTGSPGEKLCESRDKQPGLRWPIAVDNMLDRLVEIANEHGLNTNRRELMAAIVAGHSDNASKLAKLLKYYRVVTLRDATGQDDVAEIRLVEHGPGPRSRRAQ